MIDAGTSGRRPFWMSRPNYYCLRWAVSDSGPLPPCTTVLSGPLRGGMEVAAGLARKTGMWTGR